MYFFNNKAESKNYSLNHGLQNVYGVSKHENNNLIVHYIILKMQQSEV